VPLWLLLALPIPALAETAHVLPEGAAAIYSGLGAGTFATGSSGLDRDRQLRLRLDLYAAVSLGPSLQLSADLQGQHNRVLEDPTQGPCPAADDYCDPTTAFGESGVHLRRQVETRGPALTLGLGARSDAWNGETRGRWTNAGLASSSLVATLVVEHERDGTRPLTLVGWAHGVRVLGTSTDNGGHSPSSAVMGGASGATELGPASIELAVNGMTRLGGLEYGDAWVETWRPTDDRWAALRYRHLAARAKLSLPLGPLAGLHLSVGRVLLAANGPRDALDVSLGVHRYFPPSWSPS